MREEEETGNRKKVFGESELPVKDPSLSKFEKRIPHEFWYEIDGACFPNLLSAFVVVEVRNTEGISSAGFQVALMLTVFFKKGLFLAMNYEIS